MTLILWLLLLPPDHLDGAGVPVAGRGVPAEPVLADVVRRTHVVLETETLHGR